MKLSLETLARTYAAGRNYASMLIGFATSIGLISVVQQKTLADGLSDVFAGISQIAHGAASIWQVLVVVGAPLVGSAIAWKAQRSAKDTSQAAAIGASPATDVKPAPGGGAIVTIKDPAMASAALTAQKNAS